MDKFREDPKRMEYVIPLSKRDAYTVKTQFYRFFEQIRSEYEEAQFDDALKMAALHSGLNDFFHLANNLVPSARREGEQWYFYLRQTAVSDELRRLSTGDEQFMDAAHKKLKQDRLQEDEQAYQRIAAGATTDSKEERLEKADRGELSFEEMYGTPPTK